MNIDVLKDLSPAEPASAGDLPPFGLFAAGVYPFLEFRWFHEAYYRVLEAFAAGASAGLSSPCRPSMARASGLRPCCLPTCWGAIPICGSPSPPIRLRWLRSSTGACSVSSIRPNMQPFSRKRPSSGEPGLRSTCVRPMRLEIIGHRGGLLSVGREGALTGNRVDCFILDDLYRK